MENGEGKPIRILDVLVSTAIATLGSVAIYYLVRHPDNSRQIAMRLCLVTQKVAHRISDTATFVADRAGTKYNEMRNVNV